ncbi:Uncharacterised protein [Dorea longicatena]|uniref:Uncharacterized protein n=1 Tax=Dorea longicatena TaxID=88431 RepID=A0A173RHN8_9FIRM|nr:Uncharacterised protein [Dorea longicatena]
MRRRAALAIWDGSVRNHTSNRGACGMVKQKGGIACIWGKEAGVATWGNALRGG